MPNQLALSGAQPARPTRKVPLYNARFTTGLWTNRNPLRDAASTRLEEKFYGARGDGLLGGVNVESTQRLTYGRRPGSSVYNNKNWNSPDSFYEFRQFNSNQEQIRVVVDQSNALYDGTGPDTQIAIWDKQTGAGQSYMQSVGNNLYWGDGVSQKKWLTTLQSRMPYQQSPFPLTQNPYNFTPFELDTFIVDSNGNAEQLIATVLQLANFYILDNTIVFSLLTSIGSIQLPKVYEILTSGLQIFFDASSQVAQVLGANEGIMLTIQDIVGKILTADVYNGGAGYNVGDVVSLNQLTPSGSTNGSVTVGSIGNATGNKYSSSSLLNTTTSGAGSGATISIVASSGSLVSASVVVGGINYNTGDYVYPTQTNAYGGAFLVTGISGGVITSLALATGSVKTVTLTDSGDGYYGAQNVPTTAGTGIGLTLNITSDLSEFSCSVTYSGGPVTSASVADGGNDYIVGNIVVPQQSSQQTSTGLELIVTSITGEIENLTYVSGGPAVVAYTTGAATYTTSGAGTGASFTISSVSGGLVTGVTVSGGGTGFVVGDLIYLSQGSAHGAILAVATVTGSTIATISIMEGGYTAYTTAAGVATTTSGSGTGLTLNITAVASGAITSTGWNVDSGGSGYAPGDRVYPSQSTASGAEFIVSSLEGDGAGTMTLDTAGSLYLSPTIGEVFPTTTSGGGTGATVSIRTTPIVRHGTYPTYTYTGGQLLGGNIVGGGSGYSIGDLLYPTAPARTGGGGGSFQVSAVTSLPGPISSVAIQKAGTGYLSALDLPSTGGSGSGATFNITVANEEYYPLTNATDTPTVFIGGNPISDSRTNTQVVWGGVGETTIDGSALWINRGPVIDNGLVYNWGMVGGTTAPSVVVNNAVGGWASDTYYNQWQFIVITVGGDKYLMKLITAGKSGSSAPSWNTVIGQYTTDGTAKWQTLSNDGDTTLAWAAAAAYNPGHVLEETVTSVACIFQLQPYSGILTQGSNFPVYCWQCNGQSGSDVGAAGEVPSGSANAAMTQNGGQSVASATYSGTMNSLFLSTGGSNITTSHIAGDGTVSGSASTLFPANQNLSLVMQPTLLIPAAGIYTFTIGHQVAMFWGIGNGTVEIDVTSISIQGGILSVTSSSNLDNLLTTGVDLTFGNLTVATFLNNQTISVTSVSGKTLYATYTHANYGPAEDSGTVSSGASLAPTVISGPLNWKNPASPNVYDFTTGTPVSGYPIMSANYPNQGTSIVVDTVQISFPSAGSYPAELYFGAWYHSVGGYSAPTTSPTLPGTTFSFYMVYSPPGGSTNYNIIPEGIACSSASTPTFPAWPATVADLQAIAPAYPSVVETSGNFTWWNLGPATTFDWNASVNMATNTFIVDPNSFEEVPYESGVSGTTEPTFSTVIYGLVADLPNLVWMNNGTVGNTPVGTLTTTEGGWSYVVALVNTLDNTVSNASPPSVSTGNFFSASGVFISGGIPQSPDPQADYVAIFRTDDGGATYFLIPPPNSGNGNVAYTLPLDEYIAQGYTDTTPDSGLNTLLEAPIELQNSVPPKGIINLAYSLSSIFGSVGNTVYWSTGPQTPVGNGLDGFDPNNYAEFPSLVTRIVPLNVGILVNTVSDIYLLTGNNTPSNPITPNPLLQRIGLLSYNALTVNGSVVYFMTADQQVIELNVHSGVSQIGSPIADQFTPYPVVGPVQAFTPSTSYLTWHVNGNNDQCLFVSDGTTGWFRLSPTAAPETGLTWGTKANIVGGCKAVLSIETTPGNNQLLIGPSGTGPILYRDYNVNADNGRPYPANFTLGSLVLAQPGQLADVDFITADSVKTPVTINEVTRLGLPIGLGVLLGEISGEFENLYRWTQDPPQLLASETVYAQRFYLSQTEDTVECRHMQIYVDFGTVDYPSEILSLTAHGGFSAEG